MSDHLQTVALKEVAGRAEAVLVVTPARPPQRNEVIDITPKGEAPLKEKYPSFRRYFYRFRVEELLFAVSPEGRPKVGEVVEVDRASYGYDLKVHKLRYLDGVNKITMHESYEPSASPGEGAQILFVSRSPMETWAFACDISLEG